MVTAGPPIDARHAESTLKSDGTQKINLNGNNLQKLYNDLKTSSTRTRRCSSSCIA